MPDSPKKQSRTKVVFIITGVLWSLLIAVLAGMTIKNTYEQTKKIALHQGRSFFQQIVTTRSWNANHGGVYVPVTERTEPNPYLDIPDRDVITRDGQFLTKINPAFMTRQVAEIAADKNLVWFHITSLKPIRPANDPRGWEQIALKKFREGADEHFEFIENTMGRNLFRYMAPLWVKPECLKCHAKQGYREGDLRGGISVTLQAEPLIDVQNEKIRNIILTYTFLWIVGLLGLTIAAIRLVNAEQKQEKTIAQLERALSEVKQLSGLLPICASCKKIRDDSGYWKQIEAYIRDHSEAKFSHSICPECAKKLYPEFAKGDEEK